jgi:hypothetical protein
MKLLDTILIILSMFDIVTTWIIFQHGGRELNPFMAPLGIYGILLVRIIFVIGIIYLINNYFEPHSEKYQILKYSSLVAYCGISTIWLAAILNNLFYIVAIFK